MGGGREGGAFDSDLDTEPELTNWPKDTTPDEYG
jgi:hypothetical protein